MVQRVWLTIAAALLLIAVLVAVLVRGRSADAAMMRADPERILGDDSLSVHALARGAAIYNDDCASCHGPTGRGEPALDVPNLGDTDHLYGQGRVAEIEQIALHGIRSGDRRGWNLASMPGYGRLHPSSDRAIKPLSPSDVRDVVQFLLSLSGRAANDDAANRGGLVYATRGGCYDCHGTDARGDPAIGAPDLGDRVWLYGDGSAAAISHSLQAGRAGVSPAFAKRISAADARAVAVYVASLAPPERR